MSCPCFEVCLNQSETGVSRGRHELSKEWANHATTRALVGRCIEQVGPQNQSNIVRCLACKAVLHFSDAFLAWVLFCCSEPPIVIRFVHVSTLTPELDFGGARGFAKIICLKSWFEFRRTLRECYSSIFFIAAP